MFVGAVLEDVDEDELVEFDSAVHDAGLLPSTALVLKLDSMKTRMGSRSFSMADVVVLRCTIQPEGIRHTCICLDKLRRRKRVMFPAACG
eukprot:4819943-Amphidinium_carterae.1